MWIRSSDGKRICFVETIRSKGREVYCGSITIAYVSEQRAMEVMDQIYDAIANSFTAFTLPEK